MWFPLASISILHLYLFPHIRMKSVPWADTLISAPIHHINIHLGSRISTAWDIRPITQSHQTTSSSPPTLTLCSNLFETMLCLTQAGKETWGVLEYLVASWLNQQDCIMCQIVPLLLCSGPPFQKCLRWSKWLRTVKWNFYKLND